MMLIRVFEENAIELFGKGLITGSTHPCIAQEAISVGACSALGPHDLVLATYRGHGAALAKGSDPKHVMAELLTRTTGCCKGRGGSMHLCDKSVGFLGTNAIVAAHIPMAGGVALSAKLRKTGEVVLCFFSDGASCEASFELQHGRPLEDTLDLRLREQWVCDFRAHQALKRRPTSPIALGASEFRCSLI